jgi:hypothetical protein
VDARIALEAFVALLDGHPQKMADALQVLATSDQVRSAGW